MVKYIILIMGGCIGFLSSVISKKLTDDPVLRWVSMLIMIFVGAYFIIRIEHLKD